MSHEVESMMYVGEVPWHGLGVSFKEAPGSMDEVLCAAGLNWQVEKVPVVVESTGAKTDHFAIVRSTDQKVLGVVGKRFEPLQNSEAVGHFQPFLDNGFAAVEAAGSLKEGRRIWCLARLIGDDLEVVDGDTIRRYILLSHGHDGGLAINYGLTPIRVVCANTEALARSAGDSLLLKFRHTQSVRFSLDKAQEMILRADDTFKSAVEHFRLLSRATISDRQFEDYVRITVLRSKADIEDLPKQSRDRLASIKELYTGNARGAALRGVRGTMWGAYNAVTAYWSWNHGRTADNRLNNIWFGAGANDNQRALEVALKMAA